MSDAPDRPTGRATRRTFAGLFAVTLATLMLQILLTRIFSVTLWYHFAFMAVSIAMFGITFGAVWVYLRPAAYAPERAPEQLAWSTLGFAISTVVCFVLHLYVPLLTGTGRISASIQAETAGSFAATALYLGLTFALVAVPFVFSGIAVCVALTRFPAQVGRLYAADLAGAAVGCLLVVALLRSIDAPAAVFVVGAVAALAAWLFAADAAPAARARQLRGVAAAVLLVLGGAAVALGIASHDGKPLLRPLWMKGERAAAPLYEKWNSFAYFFVRGDPRKPIRPAGWGFSEVGTGRPIPQLSVAIDATAGTVMTRFDGDVGPIAYLEYDVSNLAHHLRRDADVLVVGVGGGRDVLSALRFGQRHVTGVEINGDLLAALNGRFGAFTGHLDRDPRVHFENDEARSYIARSDRRFDLIQISLIDTWAATSAGAFVLTENTLYTIEAWQTFLTRLTPTGLLSVSRWHDTAQPAEVQRLTALAAAALRAQGIAEPERHLVVVTNRPPTQPDLPTALATLLASPTPFSEQDLATLRERVEQLHFTTLLAPGFDGDPLLAQLATGRALESATASQGLDLSPPTDDRPFFFHMLRFRDAFGGARHVVSNDFNLRAVRVLGALLAIVLGLTALCLVGPLAATRRTRALPRGAWPWLVYFASIGLGFMFVEISQIQRLVVFLGHPTYGLSVLLFSLLLSSGIGSLLVPSIADRAAARRAAWRLPALLGVVAVFGLVTPAVTETFRADPTWLRIAIAVAMLSPLGLFLGAAFPLGMATASLRHAEIAPWLWGINGAMSVCASVVAIAISLAFGISAAFWVGALCYVGASAAFAVATRGAQPA